MLQRLKNNWVQIECLSSLLQFTSLLLLLLYVLKSCCVRFSWGQCLHFRNKHILSATNVNRYCYFTTWSRCSWCQVESSRIKFTTSWIRLFYLRFWFWLVLARQQFQRSQKSLKDYTLPVMKICCSQPTQHPHLNNIIVFNMVTKSDNFVIRLLAGRHAFY